MRTFPNELTINTAKKILILFFILVAYLNMGCKLDVKPADVVSNQDQLSTLSGIQYATNGVYANLASYNYYRYFHVLAEYPSDDVVWDNSSSDPAWNIFSYTGVSVSNTVSLTFWQQAYYTIYAANNIIVHIKDGADPNTDLLKGENLFLRALAHFDLARIFCQPYALDSTGTLGVIIRDSTYYQDSPKRSTIKQTYSFIVNDLIHAAHLMDQPSLGGPKTASYATKFSAYALLSRVYLYMNMNNLALNYADSVLSNGPYTLLKGANYKQYFTFNPDANSETIFAIHRTENQDLGSGNYEIGDLYNTANGGYGEIHPSDYYLQLLNSTNGKDFRLSFINPEMPVDTNGNPIIKILDPKSSDTLDHEFKLGFKDSIQTKSTGFLQIDILKYSNQEGNATLASPVVLRLAEMYLNRAEAEAKLGLMDEAIKDVNIIRARAGLTGTDEYKSSALADLKGLPSVLAAVLQERRLEFTWEAQRKFDVFRNGLPMNRTYFGTQNKVIIMPTDPSTQAPIPLNEISLNPNLVQNPGY